MFIAKVVGNLWATRKEDTLVGRKLMIVEPAKLDGTPKWRIFTRITLPMISPTVSYLVITGFIGAFKA